MIGSENGWAFNGKLPGKVNFLWDVSQSMGRIKIISGIDRTDHIIDDFEVICESFFVPALFQIYVLLICCK